MKVICISGKSRHGKDTVAMILRARLQADGYKVLITKYGDLLKHICRSFFGWDGEKDEKGRHLLQFVGTDIIRAKSPNFWVDFLAEILTFFPGTWDYVLVPDCRFPNESSRLVDAGFDTTHLRVIRENYASPLTPEQQRHPSETMLDNFEADHYIYNNGTVESLEEAVAEWLNKITAER